MCMHERVLVNVDREVYVHQCPTIAIQESDLRFGVFALETVEIIHLRQGDEFLAVLP